MFLALLTATALAADFTVHDGWMLEAEPGTLTENGVGAPTVFWNKRQGEWMMFFEARLNRESEACPRGFWAIGVARSIDGLTWTADEEPLIKPEPDTYFSCVAAHPNVVVDKNTVHLFFKAEQEKAACHSQQHPWGCEEYTGVGYYSASTADPLGGAIRKQPALITGANFGYPAVTKAGDDWWMFLSKVPALHVARSSSPDTGWVLDNDPIISPGEIEWTDDRVFNPAVACRDDDLRFQLWVGGKSLNAEGNLVESGFGDVILPDGHRAYVGLEPTYTWPATEAWRHWDVLRSPATNDWIVWFSERDENGRNRIGMAYTRWPILPDNLQLRSCGKRDLVPVSQTDAQLMHLDEDMGLNAEGTAAGCSTGSRSGSWLLVGLLLPFLRRRRD